MYSLFSFPVSSSVFYFNTRTSTIIRSLHFTPFSSPPPTFLVEKESKIERGLRGAHVLLGRKDRGLWLFYRLTAVLQVHFAQITAKSRHRSRGFECSLGQASSRTGALSFPSLPLPMGLFVSCLLCKAKSGVWMRALVSHLFDDCNNNHQAALALVPFSPICRHIAAQ